MRNRGLSDNNNDYFGFNPRELSLEQQRQYLRTLVQRANKRMQRLAKADIYSYAYNRAERELARVGRTRFSYKIKSPAGIINEIYLAEAFLAHESSFVRNVRGLQDRAFKTLTSRLKHQSGIRLDEIKLNRNAFYKFLNSQQFKDMANKYGSDWVIEDMARALEDEKVSLDDVIAEYQEFMKEDLPLDAVEKKRIGAVQNYDEYRKLYESREKPKYRDY